VEYVWLKWALNAKGDPFAIERAHDLAVALMAEHGLADWTLQIGRAVKEAGSVTFPTNRSTKRWNGQPGTITLSGPLMSLWTEQQQRLVILHEIAHARAPDDGHGPLWQHHCIRLGIAPSRLWGENGEVHAPLPWTGTCPAGHVFHRARSTTRDLYCLRCSRVHSDANLITWRKAS